MNAQFLRRLTGFVCLLVSVSAFAQSLQLKPGKPNAWHESGENISFQVSGAWDQQVSYTIRYDDRQAPIAEGVIPAPGGSGSFNYRATEPGILFVDIRSTGQTARTVVAVDPLKIQPLEQEPDDFDQFWQRQRDQLNGVPMDAQQFQQYVNGKSITYSFSFNNIDGRRTYGQVCIPNGPGPFPAVLILPSYGVANALPDPHFLAESANVIVATVSIHNAPVTQIDPQAYQPDDFFVPEGNYYRQAILGGRRAIDFLYTLPAFNKTQLGVFGISQGGGLACAVAGLDPRVGFLSVAVPALAEHQGHSYGKAAGFPYYVWRAEALVGRDNLSGVKSAVKYYDAIYFAKRFKGIASFYIGYQDNVCPAATGLAAFNQVQGTKMSAHFLRMGHDTPVQYYDDQLAYMRRYWGAATNDPATGLAADAGPDQLISIGQHAFLKGKVDRNGVSTENLPAQWRQISGPAQVQLMNAAGYQIEASFPLPGSYQFRFEVRDESTLEQQNFLKTLSDEITVQITEEEQPCLLQPEVQFFPPSVLGASDGSLCISIDNLPASFNWSNGQESNCAIDLPAGTYRVTITSGNCQDSLRIVLKEGPPPPPPPVLPLCDQKSAFPWHEWIAGVQIGNQVFRSGKSEYAPPRDTFRLVAGRTYPLELTVNFSWENFNEHWQIWADLDKSGTFSPEERLFHGILPQATPYVTAAILKDSLTLQGELAADLYDLRVIMSRDTAVNPCGTFPAGEVEDYKLLVVAGDTLTEPLPPTSICTPGSRTPWFQYIAGIQVDKKKVESGKSTYSNFRDTAWQATPGAVVPLLLTEGLSWYTYDSYWRIWLDNNGDEQLESTEIIFEKYIPAATPGIFSQQHLGEMKWPDSLPDKPVLMRIALNRDGFPEPCTVFEFGEAEDYSVQKSVPISPVKPVKENPKNLLPYPNPASGEVKIPLFDLNGIAAEKLMLQSNTGAIIKTTYFPTTELDIQQLSSGIYFLYLQWPDGEQRQYKIIKQ